MGNKQVHGLRQCVDRIVCLTRDELHPIVYALGQPCAEVALGKPAPPSDLGIWLDNLVNAKRMVSPTSQERRISCGEDCIIPVLQCGEEGVVPLIKRH